MKERRYGRGSAPGTPRGLALGVGAALVIVLWFGAVLVPGAVGAPGPGDVVYTELWRDSGFLMDVLLQVLPVPNGLGFSDLMLLGRNYETREALLQRVRWDGDGFRRIWTSPNLYEPASPITVAAGDFAGRGRTEVVVATNSHLRLFAVGEGGLTQVDVAPNPLGAAWESVGLQTAPGERHRLGLTRVERVEDFVPQKQLVWFTWTARGWRRRPPAVSVGAVRSVAALRLGDGAGPVLVVERGKGTEGGWVDRWRVTGRRAERLGSQQLRPAAVFALAAGSVDSLEVLAVGDNRGRVGLYYPGPEGALEPWGEPVPAGWGLSGAAVADVDGDGRPELVAIGYPARLHVLAIAPQ